LAGLSISSVTSTSNGKRSEEVVQVVKVNWFNLFNYRGEPKYDLITRQEASVLEKITEQEYALHILAWI
jgi:hypothetical protein